MSANGEEMKQSGDADQIPIIYIKSLLTDYIRKYDIVLLCIVGGLLLTFLFGRHEFRHLQVGGEDSRQYHFMAVNMMQGKGCYAKPVGSVEDYNAQTIEKFDVQDVVATEKSVTGIGRLPIYPLFLQLIYSIHGVDVDAVLPYQLLLTGLTGVLMVLTGWLMFGWFGAIAGLIAVLVYGMNRELAWPTCELLTECLATFLLTAAAAAASWARRGSWKRESIVSLLFILAVFTRPACFFIVIPYGIILVLQYFPVSKRRILVFTGLWVISIFSWSIFAFSHKPETVEEKNMSIINQVLYASFDPVTFAKRGGQNRPEINVASLTDFWFSCEIVGEEREDYTVIKLLRGIPGRWKEVVKIKIIALKVGTDWMPRSLLVYVLLGIALVGCTKVNTDKLISGKDTATEVYVRQRGILRSNRILKIILYIAALLIMIITLGYSSTFIQMFFWLLPVVMPFFCIEYFTHRDVRFSSHRWVLSWYWGYVIMCMITISLPRFIRPFMPIFYLCAVMAIPLLVMTLLGLRQSAFRLSKEISIKFNDSPVDH